MTDRVARQRKGEQVQGKDSVWRSKLGRFIKRPRDFRANNVKREVVSSHGK